MKSLKKLFNDLLPIGLANNISIFDYWNLTYSEIYLLVKTNQERIKLDLKNRAKMDYQQAQLIACFVSGMFKKDPEYPAIYDVYPSLFKEEKEQAEKIERIESINRLKEFSRKHNEKMKRGE